MVDEIAEWLMAAELDGQVDLSRLDRPPEGLLGAFAEAYRTDDYSSVQGCSVATAHKHVEEQYSW